MEVKVFSSFENPGNIPKSARPKNERTSVINKKENDKAIVPDLGKHRKNTGRENERIRKKNEEAEKELQNGALSQIYLKIKKKKISSNPIKNGN